MSRYTGPKNRLARKFETDLGLKSGPAAAKLARRLNIPPGQHGPKGRKRQTEYGQQLTEKQKLKAIYGLTEKQLRRYFEVAAKTRGATGATMIERIESRLDNTVYRLGLTPTRASARQLVNHGHVNVDGKKVDIPSFLVKPGQVINLDPKSLSFPFIAEGLKNESPKVPPWLEKKAAVGKIASAPKRDQIDLEINEQFIVEFYSR